MLPPRPPGPGPSPGWDHRRPAGPPRRLPIPGGFVGDFVNNLCNSISSCFYFFCCCWLLRDCFGASLGPLAGLPPPPPPPPQIGSYGPLSDPPDPPEEFGGPPPSHIGFYGPPSGPPSPPRVFGGPPYPSGEFGGPPPIGLGAPPGDLEGIRPF